MIDFSNQQISIPNFGYLFLRMPETCCNPVKLAILSDLDTLIIVIDTRFKGKETNVDAVDPFPVRLFFVSFRLVFISADFFLYILLSLFFCIDLMHHRLLLCKPCSFRNMLNLICLLWNAKNAAFVRSAYKISF